MTYILNYFVLCFVALHIANAGASNVLGNGEPKQAWNYVNVRPNAYMFWWLYYSTAVEGYNTRPLVIWLQGGPGGSSTGFGNFVEIGPLDVKLKKRNVTWVSEASILFIDNPVGTGYSYVTNNNAFTKNVHEIAVDLVTMMKAFLDELPDFKTIPLYIFSESYGGKMAVAFSELLYKSATSGSIQCDFRGIALGDSWISPIDSIMTWGPYLYATSLVDELGQAAIDKVALECAKALARGEGKRATELWSEAESVTSGVTDGVNWYNILLWNNGPSQNHNKTSGSSHSNVGMLANDWLRNLFELHVCPMQEDDLSTLMNGQMRKKLGIIPDSVTWGGQSSSVFKFQSEDFMKPVTDTVDLLLNSTKLTVAVYNGQLDLIVDTLGTEKWVESLKWSDLVKFNHSQRTCFHTDIEPTKVAGYYKTYNNFAFYWILAAGHMIPLDAPNAAMWMLKKVVQVE